MARSRRGGRQLLAHRRAFRIAQVEHERRDVGVMEQTLKPCRMARAHAHPPHRLFQLAGAGLRGHGRVEPDDVRPSVERGAAKGPDHQLAGALISVWTLGVAQGELYSSISSSWAGRFISSSTTRPCRRPRRRSPRRPGAPLVPFPSGRYPRHGAGRGREGATRRGGESGGSSCPPSATPSARPPRPKISTATSNRTSGASTSGRLGVAPGGFWVAGRS